MSASFKRIDYSLRPAKHAERRMLCELYRRVTPFCRIENYVYVGFGSIWFSDFSLFHRALGIKNMISIEQAVTAEKRVEENKPFRIPVIFSHSKDALPKLDWSKHHLLWLDYDDPLSLEMLHDMQTVASRAKSGTVLTISVQCTTAPQVAEAKDDNQPDSPNALDRFINLFGRERVPNETVEVDLYSWRLGQLSRKILLQEIEAGLAARNSGSHENQMKFKQICEIEYEDGAKMTTLVGIFYSPEEEYLLAQCQFETLDFLPNQPKPIRINVPKLTVRELKKLESQLPLQESDSLQIGNIPQSDANHFVSLYRYLPNFAVLEG